MCLFYGWCSGWIGWEVVRMIDVPKLTPGGLDLRKSFVRRAGWGW
jgi:hypothetical protein